jgi:hypothetical protein
MDCFRARKRRRVHDEDGEQEVTDRCHWTERQMQELVARVTVAEQGFAQLQKTTAQMRTELLAMQRRVSLSTT